MKEEKYNRQVNLYCPTCGSDQFKRNDESNETSEFIECASCGRKISKDELIEENNENLSEHVKEIGEQAMEDMAKEIKDSFKKAFKGNKYIKFK